MRRILALTTAVLLTLTACGGGGDDDAAADRKGRETTSSTAEADAADETTTTTTAPDLAPSPNPTTPPKAPPGAAPLDLSGAVWGIEPISGTIALQTLTNDGANGVVLVLAKDASIKGATSTLSALAVGQQVRIVGFSERVGERRLFTAVEVVAS